VGRGGKSPSELSNPESSRRTSTTFGGEDPPYSDPPYYVSSAPPQEVYYVEAPMPQGLSIPFNCSGYYPDIVQDGGYYQEGGEYATYEDGTQVGYGADAYQQHYQQQQGGNFYQGQQELQGEDKSNIPKN
jgi:hypothetical protein